MSALPSNRLLVQWHITDRCPRRCAHCYIPDHSLEPSLDELRAILDQWVALDLRARQISTDDWRLDFNLTGGELLSHPQWREFLNETRTRLPQSRIALLLSGELLTEAIADELAKLRLRYVQFSLDGSRKAHEAIRGPKAFETAIAAIQRTSSRGIPTVVSHTAFPGRLGELAQAAKAARKAGAESIWTDRVVPGPGDPHWDAPATQAYLDELREVSQKLSSKGFKVRTSRALQFLSCGGQAYKCSAGKSLLAVLADGTVAPCRRLPDPIGRLPADDPWDLWTGSEKVRTLAQREPEGCSRCLFANVCQGGAPCLSFAQMGDATAKDPACCVPGWARP
ncbi:MAG: radical SAM protein [Fibrobacterota bacterium]|nr:MAG: radical SAM protein [Fibrobacterota bacterium]